jgi:hypothetical protein
VGVAEYPDEWLIKSFGSTKYCMHQRRTHATSLILGMYRQRSEGQHRRRVNIASRAQDITNCITVGIYCHQGKRRQPIATRSKFIDESYFGGQ